MPGEKSLARTDRNATHDTERLAGVAVTDLDNNTRGQLELPRSVKGALVTDVGEDSAAAKAGLREGDVIIEINRESVADASTAAKLADETKGDQILLRVWSQGANRYIVVNEPHNG